jgi:caffeoyl-CoA O-methyltransferase
MLSFLPEGVDAYAAAHSSPEPPVFRDLARTTAEKTDQAEMQVGIVQGLFLKQIARATAARRIVEIGTFTGYSTLMLAEGAPADAEVFTCDISQEWTDIARAFWAKSPHGKKITLEIAPALETLEKIDGPLDLAFIDADKQSYIGYWDAVVPKVRSGGIILADNVLWSGDVLDPQQPEARALAAFNEHVLQDGRVELVMLTIRDGITMACKL